MSSHGSSSDTELTPGKRPAALSSLFCVPSPPDTGATPSGSNPDFAASTLSAGGGDAKDFMFPQSSAPSPDLCPRASAQASDNFFHASDTLSSPSADAFSPPQDTFRTPLGAPPHKRPNQGSGRQVRPGLPEPGAGLTSTPTKAASSEGSKKEELGEPAAPSPPAGGAAALGELLATQQRRLAGLVPELEEGQRREEELVAKLEAVLQDSQVRALQSSLHCLFALTTTRNTKKIA